MDTDQLTRCLFDATDGPRLFVDVPAVLRRADRLRRRRLAVAGVAAVVIAAGVTAGLGTLAAGPDATVTPAAGSAAPAGAVAFTVRYAPQDACGFDLVLPPGSEPTSIWEPCRLPSRAPELDAPSSRVDFVRLPGGPKRLITSGSAPATTVAVLAISQEGTPLTATLHTLPQTGETVWAMQSEGNRITDLHYVLADGRRSQSNSVTQPG